MPIKNKYQDQTFMKENIERVVDLYSPNNRPLQQLVRNANGFVGDGFVAIPMPDKERAKILDDIFGKKRW